MLSKHSTYWPQTRHEKCCIYSHNYFLKYCYYLLFYKRGNRSLLKREGRGTGTQSVSRTSVLLQIHSVFNQILAPSLLKLSFCRQTFHDWSPSHLKSPGLVFCCSLPHWLRRLLSHYVFFLPNVCPKIPSPLSQNPHSPNTNPWHPTTKPKNNSNQRASTKSYQSLASLGGLLVYAPIGRLFIQQPFPSCLALHWGEVPGKCSFSHGVVRRQGVGGG